MQRKNAKKVKERQVQAEVKIAVEKQTWTDRNPVYKGTSGMENDFHGIILSTCGLLRYYRDFSKILKNCKNLIKCFVSEKARIQLSFKVKCQYF